MTTYNSYEEAKIANPDSEIVTPSEFWDGADYLVGKFKVLTESMLIDKFSWEKCNPADHCMTVEKFLADGHKFVKGKNDAYLDNKGIVRFIGDNGYSAWGCNDVTCIDGSRESFILRSAALNKPKRVEVSYVKVEDSIFDLRPDFEAGELYVLNMSKYSKCETWRELAHFMIEGELYRKVETEIDERQEFIDTAYHQAQLAECVNFTKGMAEALFDSGKFKLVSAD